MPEAVGDDELLPLLDSEQSVEEVLILEVSEQLELSMLTASCGGVVVRVSSGGMRLAKEMVVRVTTGVGRG